MGQKTHPIGFRLGVIKTWTLEVVRGEELREVAARGPQLKESSRRSCDHAGVAGVEIERAANKAKIIIYTARPGIVIGKRGAGVEMLKKEVQALTENEVFMTSRRSARPRPTRSSSPRTSRPSSSAASPSAAP